MSNRKIIVHKDPDGLAEATVEWIIASASKAIAERGRFLIALSGGSTPENAYARLAEARNRSRVDWSKVYIFFGDDRFVPPYDARSNLAMATRTLLLGVPIPYGNVFPIIT